MVHYALVCVITIDMMTSSNRNIFHVTGPLWWNSPVTGESPSQRPVSQSFDIFFYLRLNKRLSKQSRRWWFETPSRPLWLHCYEVPVFDPALPHEYEVFKFIYYRQHKFFMMTSSNGNIFRVTGPLCVEFTELWCFLWSVPEWTVE